MVGSKNFTEQLVLGELLAQAIERIGAPVDRRLNLGGTIICDRAEKRSRSGVDFLRVSNPQVINGQQTSRMLALDKEKAEAASVLVKVMQVPREPGAGGGDEFDTLVSRIVANTNWQNAINYADLVSNDRVQIEIERALRKVGYAYLRKRQK